jgi:hypothetical protein
LRKGLSTGGTETGLLCHIIFSGITGIFFGGGIIPIRVIVPHHFFRFNLDFNSNIKIRIALKSNPNILQLTTCSKLSREKVAFVTERLSQ